MKAPSSPRSTRTDVIDPLTRPWSGGLGVGGGRVPAGIGRGWLAEEVGEVAGQVCLIRVPEVGGQGGPVDSDALRHPLGDLVQPVTADHTFRADDDVFGEE